MTTASPSALVLWHESLTGSAMSKVVASFGSTLLQSTEGTDRSPTNTGQWRNRGGSSGADFHTLTVAVRPL